MNFGRTSTQSITAHVSDRCIDRIHRLMYLMCTENKGQMQEEVNEADEAIQEKVKDGHRRSYRKYRLEGVE